jgi:hypothetical protein
MRDNPFFAGLVRPDVSEFDFAPGLMENNTNKQS